MSMGKSYLTTMSLLIFHQIDAAYWQEWNLFNLPGGVEGYLLFNIIVIPIILIGYTNVIQSTSKAVIYSYGCAALGIITFLIHTVFLLLGHEQFKTPISLAILLLCLASAVWQIVQTKKWAQ